MTQAQLRLRLFGGPNGSGKSTVVDALPKEWLGIYINADNLEREWRRQGAVDLAQFELEAPQIARLWPFLEASTLLDETRLELLRASFRTEGGVVHVDPGRVNSYLAAATSDFLRHQLLELRKSFTFESVMSHVSKVEFLHKARAAGYRTYLYFVATDDPELNAARVAQRVALDGHPVDRDKIFKRYDESIAQLEAAVEATDRAYVFDNSGDHHELLVEVTSGDKLTVHANSLPHWFTSSSMWKAFAE